MAMQGLAIEIAQMVLVLAQAAWLSLGALDNLRYPSINRDDVGRVLRLETLAEHEPEIYKMVAWRRIENPQTVRRVFALIVACECMVALALWLGGLGLLLAMTGVVTQNGASTLAILAVLGFIMIWAAFLIGGQWFQYWHGTHGQMTHFLAAIWGIVTLIVLAM